MTALELSGAPLSFADVEAVARSGREVHVGEAALEAVARGRAVVDELAAGSTPAYGVSTGFGALSRRSIPPPLRAQLQRSLIRSHAAGMGPPVEREVVRAMQLLRLRTACTGMTGVRPVVVERLAALLNHGVVPAARELGSLGASGDLAPLAHVALVLMGEGEVLDEAGNPVPAAPVLAGAGIEPVELAAKEGLALINGTDGMLGMLVLACLDLERLLRVADVTCALSVEALLGTDRAFEPWVAELRPHPGQAASAANLLRLLAGSPIVASHRTGEGRVQDAYSLRCAPQVAGGARDTLQHAQVVATRELASTIDNPVVLPDGRVESNGNFHGAPLSYVCDFLAIAVADVASIAERRTDRLLDVARSEGLPAFLAHDPGVDSGLMLAQYTQAAAVSELKRLAVPASVDSIPTSAMQEDHVSMGWGAARKLRRAVDGLRRVLAVELVAGARGVELRAPLRPGAGTGAALAALRRVVPGPGPDRFLSRELRAAEDLIASGQLLGEVEAAVGPLS